MQPPLSLLALRASLSSEKGSRQLLWFAGSLYGFALLAPVRWDDGSLGGGFACLVFGVLSILGAVAGSPQWIRMFAAWASNFVFLAALAMTWRNSASTRRCVALALAALLMLAPLLAFEKAGFGPAGVLWLGAYLALLLALAVKPSKALKVAAEKTGLSSIGS